MRLPAMSYTFFQTAPPVSITPTIRPNASKLRVSYCAAVALMGAVYSSHVAHLSPLPTR
jgi:hypothetical protein